MKHHTSRYVLGVDSGASKIEIAVIDSREGLVEIYRENKPGNPAAIGIERFIENLRTSLEKTLERFSREDIVGIGIGLAGYLEGLWNNIIIRELIKILGENIRIKIFEDIYAAHVSAHLLRDGVIGILGTGSNFLGICREKSWRVGGWGHLIDDRGGAYSIGVQALSRVVRSLDGRIGDTILVKYAMQHFNSSNVHELVAKIYSSNDPKSLIASFTPLVFKAFREGDQVAREIILAEAREVALAVETIIRRLSCADIPVALTGSVYRENRDLLKELIERELRNRLDREIEIRDQVIRESCASALVVLRDLTSSVEEAIENLRKTCRV
ncbi:MAG: BadF/BadG/BcrA/BcrD ATPase family protein [Sulfolobales archaeon]